MFSYNNISFSRWLFRTKTNLILSLDRKAGAFSKDEFTGSFKHMQGTRNNSFVSYNYNAGVFVTSAAYSDTFIMSWIDSLKPQLIWSHRLTNGPHNSTQFFLGVPRGGLCTNFLSFANGSQIKPIKYSVCTLCFTCNLSHIGNRNQKS